MGALRILIMVGAQVLIPLIIVLLLRKLQRKFPKTTTLYISSKIALIFICIMLIVTVFFNFFFRSEQLLDVIIKIWMAGPLIAEKLVNPGGVDNPSLIFVALSTMFLEIFYTIILFPIVSIVFYIKKNPSRSIPQI